MSDTLAGSGAGGPSHGAAEAQRAADAVRDRLGVRAPVVAIVLGSGLGALADRVRGQARTVQ